MKKSIERQAGNEQMLMIVLVIILCLTALWAIGCGGGGGSYNSGTPTTPSTSTGNVGATITLSSTGLSSSTPRINLGDRVRFVNNDSKTHQILTTPHLVHTDCPALNSVGSLAPGQSGTSDALTAVRGCGFHDHLNPDNNDFRGQVLVGLSSNDPAPPTPGYLR